MQQQQDTLFEVENVDTSVRRDDDFYETPRWMVEALLRRITIPATSRLFEPAAGKGAIVRPLRERGYEVITNDLRRREPFALDLDCGDAGRPLVWDIVRQRFGHIDVSISNLPFDEAFPIVQLAAAYSRLGMAKLLRISFVEPTKERGPWLAKFPPARQIVLPRYSFRGEGSDMATCCWFVWNIGCELAAPGVDVVTWQERDELIALYGRGPA